MKKTAVITTAVLVALTGCGVLPSDQPREVVEVFFDAVEHNDGEAAVDCLSPGLVSQLCEEADFTDLKTNPENGVSLLASMGTGVTADEMEDMTEQSFIAAALGSPLVSSELTGFESIVVEDAVITGSTATVQVTTDGEIQVFELVQADDRWLIDSFPE